MTTNGLNDMETLFDTSAFETAPKETPAPSVPVATGVHTCRQCWHRQRWQCGGSVIQYCGVRHSNRTQNGLLKIKVTNPACAFFKDNNEGAFEEEKYYQHI